ncbi:MAG: ribosome small subunit-dependent GTPase A [Prolixibacteraceae bacterium]|nr:ribosome small subunit-dependent GTPase A [Prolixibacteraceae bacterium]
MNLEDWGYNEKWEEFRIENQLTDFEPGRIIAEHRERYIVATKFGETEAEITGNIRYTAKSREDFPAVGDWVLLLTHSPDFTIIQQILPRYSIIKRKSVKHFGDIQIIATNVDYGFIVLAAGYDFNLNRLERYLTICYESKVSPVILLTKTDLISEEEKIVLTKKIKDRIKNVPVYPISNETLDGFDELKTFIQKGKTYCLLGSSGVGKSTLINNLSGKNIMDTGSISESTQKGKHVTSHREITIINNGGILIDNPGMREVGITDSAEGIEATFEQIISLSKNCKYKDCKHINESGCAVLEAIGSGLIDNNVYQNYLKIEKEKQHFESSALEKKKKEKQFGKIVKDYLKKDIKQRGK